MLTVVCGLTDEANVITYRQDVQVLCGKAVVNNLNAYVARECTGILSFGVAGALNPVLRVDDFVVPHTVVGPDNQYILTNHAWTGLLRQELYAAVSGAIYSDSKPAGNTPEERAHLFSVMHADAVDDESLLVARFAEQNGIQLAVARVISDTTTEVIPPWALNVTDTNGNSSVAQTLEHLARQPDQFLNLINMAVNFAKAMSMLHWAYAQLGPQMGLRC